MNYETYLELAAAHTVLSNQLDALTNHQANVESVRQQIHALSEQGVEIPLQAHLSLISADMDTLTMVVHGYDTLASSSRLLPDPTELP